MAEHTGGMIALIPRADDAERLRVPGGDKADQLHLTLAYLGDDVTGWTADRRNHLTAAALNVAQAAGSPVAARVMGHAVFNPDGHGGRTPCAVYLVGDNTMISPLREMIRAVVDHEQHEPFFAHVTAGSGLSSSRLKYTGPVVFDRLRVSFADDTYDFPLGEVGEKSIADDYLMEGTVTEVDSLIEHKVMSGDPRAARLREYWAHGKGRAQWNKWRELRRKLKKYIKNPHILDGLTSNIYRLAKGHNPPRGKKEALELSEAEVKAALALADPDAPMDLDALAWLGDDDDDLDDDEFDENNPDQVYERTLVDDVDWEIDSDGSLAREDDDEFGDDEEDEVPAGPRPMDDAPSLWDLAEQSD